MLCAINTYIPRCNSILLYQKTLFSIASTEHCQLS